MPSNLIQTPVRKITCKRTCIILFFLLLISLLPCAASGSPLGAAKIRVLGISVDIDTRPDVEGIQSVMTIVKRYPAAVQAVAGFPGETALPVLSEGMLIRAKLSGPGLDSQDGSELSSAPNEMMALPDLVIPGEYFISNVRLEDKDGNIILRRDPASAPIVITVIDKLLVSQVTSRPLTLEEIEEKGIVIDEDNFTAMNFSFNMTLGSEEMAIDLPMVIPNSGQGVAYTPQVSPKFPEIVPKKFEEINIPNLSIVGFSLQQPPEIEDKELNLPSVSGVIVIPGNIAFLNQFFSVTLQTANAAPEGSGLVFNNAKATIAMPLGEDGEISGDDPLGLPAADDQEKNQTEKPLTDENNIDSILPAHTNQAEFIVEGLREGAHTVNFEITGDIYIPSLGESYPLTGKAKGMVQVKNPTFSISLAHPDVVRENEKYSVFATVTNTSSSPASLFQLNLNSRSLSGASLAEGETDTKTIDILLPGQAETFEYRMIANCTGKVTGTVFLADDRINGSFVLTTGVGDTGIPLSPDTLILPGTVDYLPDDPDLVFAAVRLLGQAYSLATAPGGSLPADVSRISKNYVFEKAVKLAQAGLHVQFGEDDEAVVQDILMDYLGSDMGRLGQLYAGQEETAGKNIRAFDDLRRTADAGKNFSEVAGRLLATHFSGELVDYQMSWAEHFASRPPHLSFGIRGAIPPEYILITDKEGNRLGRPDTSELVREIPFGDRFDLLSESSGNAELLFIAAPESDAYTIEFLFVDEVTGAAFSLVLPDGDGMKQVVWSDVSAPAGSRWKLTCNPAGSNSFEFTVDTDGDGLADLTLAGEAPVPVADVPPKLVGVQQWAKGNKPVSKFSFQNGDPLGRMTGILFSEEITKASATDIANYAVSGCRVEQISYQPDRRMVFLTTSLPVGPFVKPDVSVTGLVDMRGNEQADSHFMTLEGDPERGIAGRISGRVQGPDGSPVPFAEIKYIQPVFCPECDLVSHTKDYLISTLFADAQGQYQVDFVLQNENISEEGDRWLNEKHAGGTNHFKLEASDPVTGNVGTASTRIRFDGQHMVVNMIIRGYGSIVGNVYEEDGNGDMQPVIGGGSGVLTILAKNISTGETFGSWVDESGYYAFPRAHEDAEFSAPEVTVGNTILRILRVDGSDISTGVTTVNLPGAGMTVAQDIVLMSPNRYGTVSGRVLESDGVTGADGVLVQVSGQVLTSLGLYERTYGAGVVGSTRTDENGFYTFESVPAGDIEVRAFRQSTYEQAGAKAVLGEQENKSLTLVLPGASASVSGTVVDAEGTPVAGAKVAAGITLTETDGDGKFSVSGLPTGRLILYGQAPDSGATGEITIDIFSSEDAHDNLVIILEPVGTISGTVYEYKEDVATPVPGQKVQLWTVDNKGVMAEACTSPDGKYKFAGYPVGDYSVRAVRKDYGDGGMALASITYPYEHKDADIYFRGLAEITGEVQQSNGTAVIADIIITRKVWRIITDGPGSDDNYYLEYINMLQQEVDAETAAEMQKTLEETGATFVSEYFMLVDEPVYVSSNILGPNGEVTGRYHYDGPVTAGPVRVAAFGPFLAPVEITGEIPRIKNSSNADYPAGRICTMETILLEPSTGRVSGTVFMPDGETPAGAGVKVSIRSLDSSGSVRLPETYGWSVEQPVLPEYSVLTDINGFFDFPTVLKGRFVLTADTLVPDPAIEAKNASEAQTGLFYDADAKQECDEDYTPGSEEYEDCLEAAPRALNVRLMGQVTGVVQSDGEVEAGIRLNGVAEVKVGVVKKDDDGTATPVPSAKILFETASSLDGNEGVVFTDENGEISFFPVIEGAFSVSAQKQGFIKNGRSDGKIASNPADGTVVPVVVTMGAVTGSSGQVVTADIFGTVKGTVFKADGTPLENPAEVTVTASGVRILTTSDETGGFKAELVPGGIFRVDVFEPFTARRGTARGRIENDNSSVDVSVTLTGLGTVNGQVMKAGGTGIISGADVVLSPSGNFSDRLISRTDDLGGYSLPGVPVGSYTVLATDYDTNLTGMAQGVMTGDGDTITTDVYMEPSGSIVVTLYGPGVYINENGDPVDESGNPFPGTAPVSAGTNIIIKGSGVESTDRTNENGIFSPPVLFPAGTYTITATAGNDGAEAGAVVAHEGETVAVSMALAGLGTVSGVILDCGTGSPAGAAEVVLHSRSPWAPRTFETNTGTDGAFSIPDVPVGKFSISAVTSGTIKLGASASGEIIRDGDAAVFEGDDAICLQDSGEIKGRAVLADGVTPAAGAIVETASGNIRTVRLADGNGDFSFAGLPFMTYSLSVREPETNSVAGRSGLTVSADNDLIDLGTLVLDGDSPVVLSTSPGKDASDVNPSAIVLTFSEDIDPLTVTNETFQVLAGGAKFGGSPTVSGPVLTFTPDSPFPDLNIVSVIARGDKRDLEGRLTGSGIGDMAGLGMASDYMFTFTTGDRTPPAVKSISPADGAVEAGLDSVVRVEFTEPADRTSFTLSLEANGTPVAGSINETPAFGDQVFIFTPGAALSADTLYTVRISGHVKDLKGNAMETAEITSTFATFDTLAPGIGTLNYDQGTSLVHGNTIRFTAVPDPTEDIAVLKFLINGETASIISEAPYEYDLYLDPDLGSEVTVSVVAADAAGNWSEETVQVLSLSGNLAPTVEITRPEDKSVNHGENVQIEVHASDDTGLASVSFAAGGIPAGLKTVSGLEYDADFFFTIPGDAPAGSTIILTAAAADTQGQTSVSEGVTLTVEDNAGPEVTIGSPADNAVFDPGESVSILVTAEDVSGVSEIKLTTAGTLVSEETRAVDPAVSPASGSFTIVIPADAQPAQTITVTATATDSGGNTGTSGITLKISDKNPPVVTLSDTGVTSPLAGEEFRITVIADDETGVMTLRVSAGGFYTENRDISLLTHTEEIFTFIIPEETPVGSGITITATAWDKDGNEADAAPVVITTTDDIPPAVSITSPADGAVVMPGEPLAIHINATDNHELASVSYEATGAVDAGASEPVSGNAAEIEAEFTLDIPADAAPDGTFTLSAGAVDVTGNTIKSESITLHVADIIPPEVSGVTPADGTENAAVNSLITVEFSEPLLPSTVDASSIKVIRTDGSEPSEISGSRVLTDQNRKIVWVPDQGLAFGGKYKISVSADVTDVAGNSAAAYESEGFTVTGFAVISPAAGDRAVEGQVFALRSNGDDTEGIRSVKYLADGIAAGTGGKPAPFEAGWEIPVISGQTSQRDVSISAEAVTGGENLALNAQIDVSDESKAHSFAPSRAADGNTDPAFYAGSVAAVMGAPGWWEADLERITQISRLEIHLNNGCCQENNRFAVLVAAESFVEDDFSGESLPDVFTNGAVKVYETSAGHDEGVVSITGPFTGRYVRVVHLGEEFLGLAEVEIFEREAVVAVPEAVSLTVFPAGGDEDGDGATNGEEIAAGTDPFN